jgi:hypothetical protein
MSGGCGCGCGCVGVWVCGCVGVWVCGCVGVWVCGSVGVWGVCGGCVGGPHHLAKNHFDDGHLAKRFLSTK